MNLVLILATPFNTSVYSCSDPEECARESIPIEKFQEHVTRLHADGELGFSQEYEVGGMVTMVTVVTVLGTIIHVHTDETSLVRWA